VFFLGKGGVGKTTCAAATAVALARARGGRVVVVSTDPAHSLGDVLGAQLSARPRPIAGVSRLDALELDASRAFRRWLAEHRGALADVLEHGTWLDRGDVESLLDLSVPGLDELVGLIEIGSLARSPSYATIVVDTAPTGHTLRLLAAPDTVAAVAGVLDAMQAQHRIIREQLARVGGVEAADRLIALVDEQARDAADLLRNRRRSVFHWVMLPEELSLAESEDGLRALRRRHLPIGDIIVNRVTPAGVPCPICDPRRAAERHVIERIARRLRIASAMRLVPAELREPRGVNALARIGAALTPDRRRQPPVAPAPGPARASADRIVAPAQKSAPPVSNAAPPELIPALEGARLLLFGGKGGVGKTTCAAAAAIGLARADRSRRVVLLSTDPAHSLSDVFGVKVNDRPRTIRGGPPNLLVRELDAMAALAARRTGLEAALNEIVSALGTESLDINIGGIPRGRSVGELLDLAPPGIDELFGILSVIELLSTDQSRSAGELAIVDTAPTGHALRLLEMPDAAREWLQVLMRVLLKYRAILPPGRFAAELVELSRSVRRLQDLLRDPTRARFIVVTRAAAVPRLETTRLIRELGRLRIAVPAIIINALTLAPGRCRRCAAIARAERAEVAAIRRGARTCAIILTPLVAPPPRGSRPLAEWSQQWREL